MYRETKVIDTFAQLTQAEFDSGMAWLAENAVVYQFQHQERWIKADDLTETQRTALEVAILNGSR